MTTQDQQTVTGSHEESQIAPEPVQPVGEHAVPVEAAAEEQRRSAADLTSDPAAADESPSAAVDSVARPEPVQDAASTEQTLFADDELADLRARWSAVQAAFVDDPKECVHKADGLVSDLVEQLTTGFGRARSRLEEQWARGEEASTEDLRVALMHYREFFDRLLAV